MEFNITSDSTVLQLDLATFRADGSGISTLSLYKMLVMAELEKSLTNTSVSWLKVERKTNIEAGMDGFDISVKTGMKFCRVKDPKENEKVTCKNICGIYINAVKGSKAVGKCFRFRFERVGGTFKVQRPYVMSTAGISLEKGKPLKISASAQDRGL